MTQNEYEYRLKQHNDAKWVYKYNQNPYMTLDFLAADMKKETKRWPPRTDGYRTAVILYQHYRAIRDKYPDTPLEELQMLLLLEK